MNPSLKGRNQGVDKPKSDNVFLKKLGALAVGIIAVAFFDLLPLMQMSNRSAHVIISYKGIALGWMALCVGVAAILPEGMGIAWVRAKGQRASAREKALIGVVVAVSLGMTAVTVLYTWHQGYTLGF